MPVLTICTRCGDYAEPGTYRCTEHRTKQRTKPSPAERGYDDAWRRLSKRIRRASPFCETCPATTDLTVDHIIPITERPDLRLEPLNCRVLCRTCNGRRQDQCTDAERNQVLDAIAARRARTNRQPAR